MKVKYAGKLYYTEKFPIQRLKNAQPEMQIKLYVGESMRGAFIMVPVSDIEVVKKQQFKK
ncbi:MAG TPA: hypothetical protein PKL13_01805 [bacterium]|nr:hypothetical protein [bacterium]